jgi:cell division protein FtsN
MRLHQRQLGSTLTGFIAGLLVGLALALAVAAYISKVPIPLVDRGVQRQPDQDAIERERNRDWNPNASLGGAATPATPAAPAPEAPAAVSPATTERPPASPADPLGELIQAHNPGPAAPADTPPLADPFIYFVQAGAFRGQAEAESQRARLAMLGLQAEISEREQAGRPVFRVRLGPFTSKVDADILQERLSGQGIEANLVRVQR